MKAAVLRKKVAEKGYALLLAMFFAGISLMLLSSTLSWSASGSKVTERNNVYNRAVAAAEAGTEAVIARMDRDFINQSLNYANLGAYRAVTPMNFVTNGWADDYEFSDNNGHINQANLTTPGTNISYNIDPQLPGLYGISLPCRVTSAAKRFGTPGYDVAAAVQQDFQLATIPIFQFEAFYTMDLEINPGPIMAITGKVHGNRDLYLAPQAGLEFYDAVEAVGRIHFDRMANDPQYGSTKVMPVFDSTHTEKVSSLSLPIGTNNAPSEVIKVLDIPPASEDPHSPMGAQRYYNKVDLIVSVTSANVSVRAGLWNPGVGVLPDVTNTVPNTYSFIQTNATFKDSREGKMTILTDFNVGAFKRWLTNWGTNLNGQAVARLNHQLNSVYVQDTRSVSGKLTVVRVINGQQLPPAGLTVATALPIYVQGHYNVTDLTPGSHNTSATKPASLVGDAVTVLSSAWNDTNSTLGVTSRRAVNTTVNAAFLAGIVPTTNVAGVKHYSGGLENFPRFMEDWSGITFTYNGSMVVMFPSRYAASFWISPGSTAPSYYQAPNRQWAFDRNFLDPQKLPPVTPNVLKLIRGQYTTVAANVP
jgi:hypothetical protein